MAVIKENETMKHILAFLPAILFLSACSKGESDAVVEPDVAQSEPVLNTGCLLSVDGSKTHIAYTYDDAGRVVHAEHFDSTFFAWSMIKQVADYRYAADRIYITYQEYAELANGERSMDYERDFVRDDTLFLISGRVDSLAGAMRNGSCFFLKFRYNEQGELTNVKNQNIMPDRFGKLDGKPWYEEHYMLEWHEGNVVRKTGITITSTRRDTTEWTYRYGSLTGSFVVSEPRNVLPDFEPLMQAGYFGKSCKNLFEGIETKSISDQREYLLDEQGKVIRMKSNVANSEGIRYDYTYRIKWAGKD